MKTRKVTVTVPEDTMRTLDSVRGRGVTVNISEVCARALASEAKRLAGARVTK